MNNLSKYKLIIFDIGGTLMEFIDMPLSWASYYEQGFADAFKALGINASTADIDKSVDILKSYNPRINYREKEVAPEIIFKDAISHLELDVDINMLINKFFDGLKLNAKIFDYSIPVINLLKVRRLIVGLLTDLPCGMPDEMFKSSITPLIDVADFYISSQSCGYRKPNVYAVEFIKNKYSLTSKEILIIGDEPKDEQTAKNAGCDFMAIEEFKKSIYFNNI